PATITPSTRASTSLPPHTSPLTCEIRMKSSHWEEADALEWVRGWFDPLSPFFGAAALAGEAMLVWLD
ncbi:hypothetical protein ACIOWH_37300, partial [Streptomyces brevispora]